MATPFPSRITPAAENFLKRLVDELDVSPDRYEAARRSYHSVGEWLDRAESSLNPFEPRVYIQGSFRLGTAIRPINESEHYDVDLVCELRASKSQITQAKLKQMLGVEMRLYAEAHSMTKPVEGRRCWTLEYADGAQFHLDALPAIPDGLGKRLLLEASRLPTTWTETAIAITDTEHRLYRVIGDRWPHSNPQGYTDWFRSRMKHIFEARRSALALEAKANVEDIPSYRVKTPLQEAVQVLKRHRDVMFADDPENKPISVIITTLAARSYSSEATVAQALSAILDDMESHITERAGVKWVENPTDPSENFADRWHTYPERYKRFREWLGTARRDFGRLATENSKALLVESASQAFGDVVSKRAGAPAAGEGGGLLSLVKRAALAVTATHRQAPLWPIVRQGRAKIEKATFTRDGFRPTAFESNSIALPKRASLRFHAKTDVAPPYSIYWQVVNTGTEAKQAGGLRGGFDVGSVDKGSIARSEATLYTGTHSIECFVVKNGYLVARSGVFIVNIA